MSVFKKIKQVLKTGPHMLFFLGAVVVVLAGIIITVHLEYIRIKALAPQGIVSPHQFSIAVFTNRHLCVLGGVLTFFGAVQWLLSRRKQLDSAEESRRMQEELYRLALAHSNRNAFRIDLRDRTVHYEIRDGSREEVVQVWSGFPECILESGYIAEESLQAVERMVQDILSGVEFGETMLNICLPDGRSAPHRVQYILLYDEAQQPTHAIVTYEDISEVRDRELAHKRWLALLDEYPQDQYRFVEQNLTHNTVDHVQGTLFDVGLASKISDFDQLISAFANRHVHTSDIDALKPLMSREKLIEDFRNGKRSHKLEFRFVEPGKEPRWVSLSIQVVEFAETGEIKSYKMYEDIDRIKKEELALKFTSERDSLTRILNRGAFEQQFHRVIEANPGDAHAFVLIDVDNLKQINDRYGHSEGDRTLISVANTLQSTFRQDDLIGRLGGDEFAVLVRSISGSALVSRRIRQMNAALKRASEGDFSVQCSAGISLYAKDGETFDELYQNADRALYRAKRAGKDGYYFFSSGEDLEAARPADMADGRFEWIDAPDRCYLFQNAEEWRYRMLLESARIVVIEYLVDEKRFCYDLNAPRYLGGRFDDRPLCKILAEDRVADAESAALIEQMVEKVASQKKQGGLSTDVLLVNESGYERWFRTRVLRLDDASELSNKVMIVLSDVHEEVLAIQQLQRMALYDELTGLHNTDSFVRNVERRIRQSEPGHYALVALDVDRFRVVNELFGYGAGNRLLQRIGGVMREIVGGEGEAARMSADHFIALLPHDPDGLYNSFIPQWVSKVQELEPNMDVVLNFGIYVIDDCDEDVIGMIDRAQAAKQTVKGGYTSRFAVYDERLRRKEQREKEVVSRMHRALENGEFRVYLQPWYDHISGELVGAEALARWEHPTRGLLLPREFIPMFEENGFISKLDRYMWKQVCRLQRQWLDAGLDPVPVSVNISRIDLFDPTFKKSLFGIMDEAGIPASMLGIEVTESMFSEDFLHVSEMLRKLGKAGFTLYMDDFGTGYSSLNTLKDLPVDVLKLDIRFLMPPHKRSEKARNILRSVLDLSRTIGVETVAEGIESREQADELAELGCRVIQGFLYSQALPPEEYELHLRQRNTGGEEEGRS